MYLHVYQNTSIGAWLPQIQKLFDPSLFSDLMIWIGFHRIAEIIIMPH